MTAYNEALELVSSELFDSDFYRTTYSDVADADVDPIAHFCSFGWREGRNPNPWFHSAWYLAANPDVAKAGLNPLLHYVRHGAAEARRPSPHFDPRWYEQTYNVPMDSALRHFLTNRLSKAALPCAGLYAVLHLDPYKADSAKGIDPFLHYLQDVARGIHPLSPDIGVISASGLFDPNHYFISSTDVQQQALDPVEHFCIHGWIEDRSPCIYFNTDWYRRTNPNVSRMRINPLVHYVLEGEKAGRRPVVFFDPVWYRQTYMVPEGQLALAHYLANRREQKVSPNPYFDVVWYVRQHRLAPNRDPFAHFLRAGTYHDIDPSSQFNSAAYRARMLGRISRRFGHLLSPGRDNPLIHFLSARYGGAQEPEG